MQKPKKKKKRKKTEAAATVDGTSGGLGERSKSGDHRRTAEECTSYGDETECSDMTTFDLSDDDNEVEWDNIVSVDDGSGGGGSACVSPRGDHSVAEAKRQLARSAGGSARALITRQTESSNSLRASDGSQAESDSAGVAPAAADDDDDGAGEKGDGTPDMKEGKGDGMDEVEADGVVVGEGEGDGVDEGEREGDDVGDGESEVEGENDDFGEAEREGDEVGEGEREVEGEGDAVGDAVSEGVGVGDEEGDAVGDGEARTPRSSRATLAVTAPLASSPPAWRVWAKRSKIDEQ